MTKFIREKEQTGIVERVPEEESNSNVDKGRVYYSPHHAVIKKDRETTKVRRVYAGSPKSSKDELSLNDCLESGDNYILHIFDMLASFRSNPVGLMADIKKAFLMVSIKEDRNMLRFLWFDDPDRDRLKIVQFRFNPLLFGLQPLPSILGATIAHHLRLYKQSEPEMAGFSKNHCTLMIYSLEQETMRRPWKFITNRRESWLRGIQSQKMEL
ncbi:uncharacterized protein [Montipora foliosa]|uniref:uncharacterized protein n=1 Tax=Montipora foliosa TaxID=591990 RepID=UPI0035F13373